MTPSEIDNMFTYHAPKVGQPERYVLIRDEAKKLALHIYANTTNSVEQTIAIRKLQESVMYANAAIALNE